MANNNPTNPAVGSSKKRQIRSEDKRAVWERPELRRLAVSEAQGGAKVNPDPGGKKGS
jgi:hypothetical protein